MSEICREIHRLITDEKLVVVIFLFKFAIPLIVYYEKKDILQTDRSVYSCFLQQLGFFSASHSESVSDLSTTKKDGTIFLSQYELPGGKFRPA